MTRLTARLRAAVPRRLGRARGAGIGTARRACSVASDHPDGSGGLRGHHGAIEEKDAATLGLVRFGRAPRRRAVVADPHRGGRLAAFDAALSAPGHRRVALSGRNTLDAAAQRRSRFRLYQGNRGRRLCRPDLRRQLGRRERRRHRARCVSFLQPVSAGLGTGGELHPHRAANGRRTATSHRPRISRQLRQAGVGRRVSARAGHFHRAGRKAVPSAGDPLSDRRVRSQLSRQRRFRPAAMATQHPRRPGYRRAALDLVAGLEFPPPARHRRARRLERYAALTPPLTGRRLTRIRGGLIDPLRGAHMSILSDRWIREAAQTQGMIEPFVESQRRDGCISYGLSSYGYDARVADEFKIFTNVDSAVVDPKDFAANSFVDRKTDCCIIPPNSFALARTVEYFRVPRDVLVICLGKSTYARCGIIVNVTPLEPGWEGHVTLEFSNTTPLPAKVYANEGACQILFLQGNEPCEVSYADRAGKYMKQQGVTLPKL